MVTRMMMGPGGVQGTCACTHAPLGHCLEAGPPQSSHMQVGSMPDALMCLLLDEDTACPLRALERVPEHAMQEGGADFQVALLYVGLP